MASEYLAPTILSSRRLFGPNLFSAHAGAVLDVHYNSTGTRRAVTLWSAEALRLARALGWTEAQTAEQRSHDSASLFLRAPVDGLLTASDLTEHAWVAAELRAAHEDGEGDPELFARRMESTAAHARVTLFTAYTQEQAQRSQVTTLRRHATEHALCFSMDDTGCSVGGGVGAREVRWSGSPAERGELTGAFDVPIALVTGSNGKTTTTRLVAAMSRAAGLRTGWSCSDGVWIEQQQVETGDFTGPTGARRVVCDAVVECAVLETARGGMLRRGLAVDRVDAAVITNISADHFGEYGVESLADLARAKMIVARALRAGAPLALNADDDTLRTIAAGIDTPVAWFTTLTDSRALALVDAGVHATGFGVAQRQGRLALCVAGAWHDLGAVIDMPITLRGRAEHNVANAAASALVGAVLGLRVPAIRQVLSSFGSHSTDNPGRLTVRDVGGVVVVMDYAHNPDGMAALCRTAAALPAMRRLLLLGQAGNRDDAQLRALAQSAWTTQRFDRVIIKEMVDMLRGRAAGEVPAVLRDAIISAGAPPDAIAIAASELLGVRQSFQWARAGDVLVLGVHVDRAAVHAFVEALVVAGWRAGDPLPEPVAG